MPRIVQAILKTVVFLAIFVALNVFLSRAIPVSNATSLSMWDSYDHIERPDTVFLGSSFAHEGVDAAAYDRVWGGRAVNMGTPAQTWEMSEVALDRALSEGSVEHVILIMDYHNMGDEEDKRVAGSFRYAELSLAPPLDRLRLAARYLSQPKVVTSADSLNFFFPWISGTLPEHLRDLRQGFAPQPDHAATIAEIRRYDAERSTRVVDFDTLGPGSTYVWSSGVLSEDAFTQLGSICTKCNAASVDLIVVCTPRPAADIVSYPGFYEFQARMVDFFASYGIPYYDYSLAKPELFVSREPDYYRDIMHMNAVGAAAFSESLARLQKARLAGEDVSALFMQPSEYLASIDYVTNVTLSIECHDDGLLLVGAAYSGTQVTPEYEFLVKEPDAADFTRFSGYSDRVWAKYETNKHGHYTFRVNARTMGSDRPFERYHVEEVDY